MKFQKHRKRVVAEYRLRQKVK